jgi:hypothetical protein
MDECAGLTLRQPFERFGGASLVARQLLAEGARVCVERSDNSISTVCNG